MTKQNKGFTLMAVAMVMLMGIGGGVEFMSPDAGYAAWATVLMILIYSVVIGLIGFSYTQEGK